MMSPFAVRIRQRCPLWHRQVLCLLKQLMMNTANNHGKRLSEKLCWIVFMILKIWWQLWKCRQKQKRCSARIQNRVCFIANQQIMMWPARPREIKTRLDSTMIMVMIEFMMIMPNIIHRPSYNIVISNTEENQNKRPDFVVLQQSMNAIYMKSYS